ncbi:phosphoribosylglycinamide formyltransferase [Oceanobacillus massiliensis]|uniref:phosphoribosylglycinamide formyltransferase n=1 Tax=Oceanobacillus massiliensis TaxID=1465765 RepID=UPI0030159C2D
MSTVKAAVFASGTGSNFQAIMDAEQLSCEIVLLVCDKPGASVLEKAKRQNVPTFVFDPKLYSSKEAYEQELVQRLRNANVSWIFLAGYMRIAGPTLLRAFEGKIINIHPSLLPAFPGKDAIGQAFKAGAAVTGVTVHYIDEGIDTGPIIAQETVEVLETDTEATLKERIQQVEHELYPRVINQLILSK